MIIDLIRHGEPEGGSKFRGHSIDDELSEKGWDQMRQAVNHYNDWDVVISSPLKRCIDFSNWLAKKNKINVVVKPDFKEVGFGDWEGKTKDEIQVIDIQAYQRFYQDPVKFRPPNAEDIHLFLKRVISSFDEIIKDGNKQRCLIVAHAGVIRAIISHVICASPLGMYRINIQNAGITRIKIVDGNPKVEFINGKL